MGRGNALHSTSEIADHLVDDVVDLDGASRRNVNGLCGRDAELHARTVEFGLARLELPAVPRDPGDQEVARGANDARQLAAITVVVEPGWREVDLRNAVLGDVLVVELQAARMLPVFALHRLVKAGPAVRAEGAD